MQSTLNQIKMTACPQLKAARRLEAAVRRRRLWIATNIQRGGAVLVYTDAGTISVHNDGSLHRTGAY